MSNHPITRNRMRASGRYPCLCWRSVLTLWLFGYVLMVAGCSGLPTRAPEVPDYVSLSERAIQADALTTGASDERVRWLRNSPVMEWLTQRTAASLARIKALDPQARAVRYANDTPGFVVLPGNAALEGQALSLSPREWQAFMGPGSKVETLSAPVDGQMAAYLSETCGEVSDGAVFRMQIGRFMLLGVASGEISPVERMVFLRMTEPEEVVAGVWNAIDVKPGTERFVMGEAKLSAGSAWPWYHVMMGKRAQNGAVKNLLDLYVPAAGSVSGFSPDAPGDLIVTAANPLNLSVFADADPAAYLKASARTTDGKTIPVDLSTWISLERERSDIVLTHAESGGQVALPMPGFVLQKVQNVAQTFSETSLFRLEPETSVSQGTLSLRLQVLYGFTMDVRNTRYLSFYVDVAEVRVRMGENGNIETVDVVPRYSRQEADNATLLGLQEARFDGLGLSDAGTRIDAWLERHGGRDATTIKEGRKGMVSGRLMDYAGKGFHLSAYGQERYVLALSVAGADMEGKTARGLSIGMTREQVKTMYGTPLYGSASSALWIYLLGMPGVDTAAQEPDNSFVVRFDGDRVSGIDMQMSGFGLLK